MEHGSMDSNQFDHLTKTVARGISRRRLLRNLARGAAGITVAGGMAASASGAEAKRRDEPPCQSWLCQLLGRCRARGERCTSNAQCCSNRCRLTVPDPKISFCD
jgi:hypothetical protein